MDGMKIRFPFVSKVVGISNYQQTAARCNVGDRVEIKREPENPYDENAYIILVGGECLGYLPRVLAKRIVTECGAECLEAQISTKYEGKATIGVEVTVSGARDANDGDILVAAPSAATARGPQARIVRTKRSGRELGTLVRIDRENRRVVVASGGAEISYPDGLIDITES
jgi:hypothetical protein